MNGYDIILTIVILLIFVFLFLAPLFSVGIQKIQNNWVQYRCNPIVMPFAGLFGEDPSKTFTYCSQTMMKDYMTYLLMPLQNAVNVTQNVGGGLETAINDARKVISSTRSFVTMIVQSIFGVILNIVVEIQKVIINMKDMVAKLVGIMTAILYMVYGSMTSMQSAWKGPPGKMVRSLCFKPTTSIRLINGNIKEIQHLKLGDVLNDGSVIEGVLKLRNTSGELFYKLNEGENEEPIYVTGSHLIRNNEGQFIPVKNFHEAIKTKSKSDILICLMTSTNRIVIGERTFWDWNDDEVAKNVSN